MKTFCLIFQRFGLQFWSYLLIQWENQQQQIISNHLLFKWKLISNKQQYCNKKHKKNSKLFIRHEVGVQESERVHVAHNFLLLGILIQNTK